MVSMCVLYIIYAFTSCHLKPLKHVKCSFNTKTRYFNVNIVYFDEKNDSVISMINNSWNHSRRVMHSYPGDLGYR